MFNDDLDNYLNAQPFRPFLIRTAGGREYLVKHPELLFKLSTGRTIIVDHGDGRYDTFDTILIESLHIAEAEASRG